MRMILGYKFHLFNIWGRGELSSLNRPCSSIDSIINKCSDDIIVMVLAKPDAIQEWRNLIGHPNPSRAREEEPTTLRARYGHDQTRNALHGSDHYHTAEREIRFMFPQTVTEPIYSGLLAKDYLKKYVNPVLVRGLTELTKEKPQEPTVSQWGGARKKVIM